MFSGSPHSFEIIKNLKRNHQDTNLTLAPKGIFHPVAWEAVSLRGALVCLYLCVYLCLLGPSKGGDTSEGGFRDMASLPLTPGSPPVPPSEQSRAPR
jgi:hypothetical protein